MAENYGPTPPEDWCEVIDRTDDDALNTALLHVRRQSPIHPPTLGQIEDAIPKRETGNTGPSKPERLAALMIAKHGAEMCKHQRAKTWNYFGPMNTFELKTDKKKPDYVTHVDPRGVQCQPCDECGKASFRVLLEHEISQGAAA
jgi:hypothetical protein